MQRAWSKSGLRGRNCVPGVTENLVCGPQARRRYSMGQDGTCFISRRCYSLLQPEFRVTRASCRPDGVGPPDAMGQAGPSLHLGGENHIWLRPVHRQRCRSAGASLPSLVLGYRLIGGISPLFFFIQKELLWGFPGGAVVENLPANAGDTGSSPGLGRSHMPRSNWTREPQLLSLRVWSLCSATREAAIVRGPRTMMKSGPHLPQLEKALAQKRRPNTAKNK